MNTRQKTSTMEAATTSQILPQLVVITCRQYAPGPTDEKIEVPLMPLSCQQQVLHSCHDAPCSGHQGVNKTLARLQQEACWVGMAEDVEIYCRKCIKCQHAKLPTPIHAPMNSIPIGRMWQIIAVDILHCVKRVVIQYCITRVFMCYAHVIHVLSACV